MSRFSNKIKELRNNYQSQKAQFDMINSVISTCDTEIANIKSDIEVCDKTSILINNVSVEAKTRIVSVLEDMVTEALATISEGQYAFKIQIEDTPKGSKCEFYIAETINGELSLQKPQDSCGGGFVDIISTTLRYVYLNVFREPVMSGPVILDEPAKMLSSDMSAKFGEFVKKLGQDFDRQTIMITHNDIIGNMSDKSIEMRKIQQ